MAIFEIQSAADHARQHGKPEGAFDVALSDWLNENSKKVKAVTVTLLKVQSGNQVLEIGSGNGRAVRDVIDQGRDVHYTGIDKSPEMIEVASTHNADLVAAGRARFYVSSVENMPFEDHCFDRAFSIGAMHFWADPVKSLTEVRRVLRPGGLVVMSCLSPRGAPDFAQTTYGFHLREATTWEKIYRTAGFVGVHSQLIEFEPVANHRARSMHFGINLSGRA